MGIFKFLEKKRTFRDRVIERNREHFESVMNAQKENYGASFEFSELLQSELKEKIERTRLKIRDENKKIESSWPEDPPKLKDLWNRLLGKWIMIRTVNEYVEYGYLLGVDHSILYYFNAIDGEVSLGRRGIITITDGNDNYTNSRNLPIQGYEIAVFSKLFP